MWSIRTEVESHHYWIIGRGDVDICLDKWLNTDLPILNERIHVKSLFLNNKEINIELASNLIGNGPSEMNKQEKH